MKKTLLVIAAVILGVIPFSACGRNSGAMLDGGNIVATGGGTSDHTDYHAPHVIHSRIIKEFAVGFAFNAVSTLPSRRGMYVAVNSDRPTGHYEMAIMRTGEGKALFSARCSGHANVFDIKKELPASVLDDMQALLEKHEVAKLNGFYKRNSARGHGFNLKVLYASGETISAGAEGGISVMPDSYWDETWFIDFIVAAGDKYGFPVLQRKDFSGPLKSFVAVFPYRHKLDGGSFAEGDYKLELFHATGKDVGGRIRARYRDPAGKETWVETKASGEDFRLLAELMRKDELIRLDGYRYGGFMPEQWEVRFRIEAEFASGDDFRVRAEGPSGVIPAKYWNACGLMDLFRTMLGRHNQSFAPFRLSL